MLPHCTYIILVGITSARRLLVCKIFHELVGILEPNLHRYNIGP